MKKLILICGPNGVGKSTASKALHGSLSKSAYIDSEYCCSINPFELNPDTIQLFKANISALMINSFQSACIQTVIFPYGFHGPREGIFQSVLDDLKKLDIIYEFHPIILHCELDENIRRMRNDNRSEERIQRAIKNTRHLYDRYDYPKIDTTNRSVAETVNQILEMIR